MSSAEPMLLVAVPQLGDPNFSHSVVLIFQHDAEGAVGLVLNRPTALSLGEFASSQDLICHQALAAQAVYQGGPVQLEQGWLLHSDASLQERRELFPGVFLSAELRTLKTLLAGGHPSFRFLLGYAGWEAGQLETEMKEGAWITVKAETRYVLHTPAAQLWNQILQDLGIDPASLALGAGIH